MNIYGVILNLLLFALIICSLLSLKQVQILCKMQQFINKLYIFHPIFAEYSSNSDTLVQCRI